MKPGVISRVTRVVTLTCGHGPSCERPPVLCRTATRIKTGKRGRVTGANIPFTSFPSTKRKKKTGEGMARPAQSTTTFIADSGFQSYRTKGSEAIVSHTFHLNSLFSFFLLFLFFLRATSFTPRMSSERPVAPSFSRANELERTPFWPPEKKEGNFNKMK